ncbi:MAG: right-handed parallel beta-helix repeat-containing protein [Spirochaetales bacterium]|nr:right-handed parallel beta-helix repeat-containing protein [Spirochaetales bacterium]
MKSTGFFKAVIAFLLACVFIPGCAPPDNSPPNDITAPTAQVYPLDGSEISETVTVVVTFDEAMDPDTLILTGTLSDDCNTPSWNGTHEILSIEPATAWPPEGGNFNIECKDLAGNSVIPIDLNYTIDNTAPNATPLYANNSPIPHTAGVVIHFDDEMDIDSLSVDITPSGLDDGGNWSETTYINDTLTINPNTAWSGDQISLTIDCDDKTGHPVSQINLSYYILYGIVYTRGNGNDTNPGTATLPKLTIQAAIDLADSLYDTAEVHVAGNTIYSVSYQSGTHITLKEGISVYGGYNPSNWSDRNTTTYVTTISDSSATGGSTLSPNRAVSSGGVTVSTILDGFTINGGGGSCSSGIFGQNSASPTIQNCIIDGGSGTTSSYGIYLYSTNLSLLCSPVIQNCSINGGSGGSSSCGLYNNLAAPTVQNNTEINGGSGSTSTYGIYNNTSSEPVIQNNTLITGGNGGYSYGIYSTDADPDILSNQTISGGSGGQHSYGIYSKTNSVPTISGNTLISGGGGSTDSCAVYNYSYTDPTIQNNDTINGGSGNISYGIYCGSYSSAQVKDNDSINGGTGTTTSYGIYMDSSSSNLIDSNEIDGGSSGSSYGIYYSADNSNSSIIRNNKITGGNGSSNAYGVYIYFCSTPYVYNNVISGGTGPNTYGLFNEHSDTRIRNNTVGSGTGTTKASSVYLYENSGSNSHPNVDNNIMYTSGSSVNYCMVEDYAPSRSCTPASLLNNDFHGTGAVLYWDEYNDAALSAIGDINAKTFASDNVNENPSFDSGFYLTGSTPASVTTGGLNGAHSTALWNFTTDKDGDPRSPLDDTSTTGWSMGAYEY